MSRYGLQRDGGLSIDNRPDFVGIAQWIFGAYLPARASGFDVTPAFDLMLAEITASEEWRQENPGRQPLSRVGSAAARGAVDCRGPDFLGIATWVFDVYLNERLRGMSPGTAWVVTENAIRATDEWRSKHRASAGLTSRSEGHKIDFELDAVPSVKGIELTAARRLARHPRVSWFGTSND
jgi:hypothetical protein